MQSDRYWMGQALAMAQTALYSTAPNPRVGCIIVRNGQVLGSGATQPAGQAHAEVMAIEQARRAHRQLRGATVYLTLEPCSHQGRTPPCMEALIRARPARVVVAMLDPNPRVKGQGVAGLRAAGIEVSVGIAAEEALALNPGFVSRMLRRRPWVWLKLASSLDGRIALPNGESRWITGQAARADGHHWRARSCVVLTGAGTVVADDPQLNVRHIATPRQPIRAIVDTRFEISEQARMLDGGPVWLFTCHDGRDKARRLAGRNVEVITVPEIDGRVDLQAMLEWMAEREINEVHVEAGSRLSGAFLQAGCVDELLVYMAPCLLGEGIPMAGMPAPETLDQAQRFRLMDLQRMGEDVRLRLREPQHWQSLCREAGVIPAGSTV
ncbi:MAG: bifunctional diaminohydroxyphosphoribosylaminopyrimidine deaminase/5-amino-6-(5-phosphoribosylamino)uracil reductase RibD [Castellaniella sp.]